MAPTSFEFAHPTVADGAGIHSLASAVGTLDVNSSYAYLLWCRDFHQTSVVARADGEVVGFITGYLRPAEWDTLFIWQVAVDDDARGQGLATRMLEWLCAAARAARIETTITADNEASIALFRGLARSHGAEVDDTVLFDRDDFPDGHDPEYLYRIGPLRTAPDPPR